MKLIPGAHFVTSGKGLLAPGCDEARRPGPFLLPACGVAVLDVGGGAEGLANLTAVVDRSAENSETKVKSISGSLK